MDGDGHLSVNELYETWSYFKQMMFDRTAARLGITEMQLALITIGALTSFTSLFIFIYCSIVQFGQQDGFSSVVSSLYLGVAGIAGVYKRSNEISNATSSADLAAVIAGDVEAIAGQDVSKGTVDGAKIADDIVR